MSARRTAAVLAVAIVFASIAAGIGVAAPTSTITGAGVGKIRLGATYSSLRAQHLLGPMTAGCEFAGPNTRSARLSAPLKGSVELTQNSQRKVTDIAVTGAGATARGLGIGATIAQIKHKFPRATIDHSTETVFGITVVRIPKSGGGKFEFGVETNTKKTSIIGIPFIPFCD